MSRSKKEYEERKSRFRILERRLRQYYSNAMSAAYQDNKSVHHSFPFRDQQPPYTYVWFSLNIKPVLGTEPYDLVCSGFAKMNPIDTWDSNNGLALATHRALFRGVSTAVEKTLEVLREDGVLESYLCGKMNAEAICPEIGESVKIAIPTGSLSGNRITR